MALLTGKVGSRDGGYAQQDLNEPFPKEDVEAPQSRKLFADLAVARGGRQYSTSFAPVRLPSLASAAGEDGVKHGEDSHWKDSGSEEQYVNALPRRSAAR